MSRHVNPQDLSKMVKIHTTTGLVLTTLCNAFPRAVSKSELMAAAGLSENVQGPVNAHTSLYWSALRANDILRVFGWKVRQANMNSRQESFQIVSDQ